MLEHVHFTEQTTVEDDDRHVRPDMIIDSARAVRWWWMPGDLRRVPGSRPGPAIAG